MARIVNANKPSRGDVWMADLDPNLGREQSGRRPVFILSVNRFNHGPAELVIVIPMTTSSKGIPYHVEVVPPDGGLQQLSFIKCEDVRSISTSRLFRKCGTTSEAVLSLVEHQIRLLLGL